MLYDDEKGEDIRILQSIYFSKQIEMVNKEFQAAVLLGLSLHDNPSSSPYHIFRTGRTPIQADVPKKCSPPRGVPTCRGSVKLYWRPPKTSNADPALLMFRIAWRPGGSTILGYDSQKVLQYADCVEYQEVIDGDGKKVMIASEEFSHVISGLTSGIPYEFRVCAVNNMGDGVWSDSSQPIVMDDPAVVSLIAIDVMIY